VAVRAFLDHWPKIICRRGWETEVVIPIPFPQAADMCLAKQSNFIVGSAQKIDKKRHIGWNLAIIVIIDTAG